MKVLWLSHFMPYPPKGGVLQRGYYLIKELSKYAMVDILAFNQPRLLYPLLPNCADPEATAVRELSEFSRVIGWEHVPLSHRSFGTGLIALKSLVSRYPYNVNWLASRSFSKLLTQALKNSSYDIVHFDTIGLAYYRALVTRYSPNSKLSLGHHNIESHMLLRRAEMQGNWMKNMYFLQEGVRLARYEKRQCPKFDLNVVCSDLTLNACRN